MLALKKGLLTENPIRRTDATLITGGAYIHCMSETRQPIRILEYGLAKHRLRWGRISVLVIVTVALCITVHKYGPVAWQNIQAAYWDYECRTFEPGEVYTVAWQEMSDTTPLPRTPPDYMSVIHWGRFKSEPKFLDKDGIPNSWTLDAMVYLHARRSPLGRGQLVCVEFHDFFGTGFTAYANPSLPYGANTSQILSQQLASGITYLELSGLETPGQVFRVYAGRTDNNDESHFTIDFDRIDGTHGIVDGWLRDDNSGKGTFVALSTPGGQIVTIPSWLTIDGNLYPTDDDN